MKSIPHSPAEARQSHLESLFWRRLLLRGLKYIPMPLQQGSMPLWSALFYAQVPHIRRAIEENLNYLLKIRPPRLQLMAFRTFTNYCNCTANAYRTHLGKKLDLPAQVHGLHYLQGALSQQKGAIIATGHLGNWQIGPYFLSQHFLTPQGQSPVTLVMHEEPNIQVQALEAEFRDQRLKVIYPKRSPGALLAMREILSRGEMIAFQMDRPQGKRSVAVQCAGKVVAFAMGPALLAHYCQTPIVPVFFPLEEQGLHIHIAPAIWPQWEKPLADDLQEITQQLAQIYERMIFSYPYQWFNFYDFWSIDKLNTSHSRIP